MKRQEIPFTGGNMEARSPDINSQKNVNLYFEAEMGGKHPGALYSTPGLKLKLSKGTGPTRGNGVIFKKNLYFVSGNELIKIDSSFTATSVGTLSTTTGWVTMAENGVQIIITDGVDGYLWDDTNFSTIVDADFPKCNYVTFLDSYFIVEDLDNVGRFYISASYDGSVWATLDFATAEGDPDDMHVPRAIHNQLWLLGQDTTEVFYNSGDLDFPFTRINNATMEWGIESNASLIQADNALFWLARNEEGGNIIVKSQGFAPQIVSDRHIEYEISTYSKTDDCEAYSYQQAGHTFVIFSFPTADKTWCYDVSQKLWHKRSSKGLGRHRMKGIAHYQNQIIVGDYLNSNFYQLDLDTYTDNGDYIERLRRSQYVHKNRNIISIYELEIEFEGGVGLTTGQGSDPQAMLRISKDGGHTWGNEIWKPIGKKGEYGNRARWFKAGKARQWIFEIKITDPVKVVILGAYIAYKERMF